jgi:hypothetical protein
LGPLVHLSAEGGTGHIPGGRVCTPPSPGGGLLRSQVHLSRFFRQLASFPLPSLSSGSWPQLGAEHKEVASFPRGCGARWLPLCCFDLSQMRELEWPRSQKDSVGLDGLSRQHYLVYDLRNASSAPRNTHRIPRSYEGLLGADGILLIQVSDIAGNVLLLTGSAAKEFPPRSGFQPMGGMMAWIPLSVCISSLRIWGLQNFLPRLCPNRTLDFLLDDDTHHWTLPPCLTPN